jgi:hypothetical protein
LAALVADVGLLEGMLGPAVVDQLLTSDEPFAAVVAQEVGDAVVKIHVIPEVDLVDKVEFQNVLMCFF